MCKAPVISSPPANQHPTFYRLDVLTERVSGLKRSCTSNPHKVLLRQTHGGLSLTSENRRALSLTSKNRPVKQRPKSSSSHCHGVDNWILVTVLSSRSPRLSTNTVMTFPILDVKCSRSAHCRADRVDENITCNGKQLYSYCC